MVYIGGVMLHLRMARLATVENLCNIRPPWFIQKPKARARCSGLIAVCPESPHREIVRQILLMPGLGANGEIVYDGHMPKSYDLTWTA